MTVKQRKKYEIPEKLREILAKYGVKEFYPPQEEALASGVLDGKNLVLAIPTAAGKTLIAEICMVKNILEGKGRCLYVAPLRALASEKYAEFKERYEPLGISVGIATGEYDAPGEKLSKFDILIATSEKVDSLLRMRTRWLGESLAVAVLDEIHYIHDAERGPTLEIVAARLRQVNPSLQILALSATVSNGKDLADWLGARLVVSDWRPVQLLEGVFDGGKIHYSDFSKRSVPSAASAPVAALVKDTLDSGGQVLVFVNSRRSAVAVARSLAAQVKRYLPPADKKIVGEIARAAGNALSEPTHLCRELSEDIKGGVAFHHAGLHPGQRKIIEDAFRQNRIKVIVATPTLAAGVNLPARRVVIRDWTRYEMGRGQRPIPVFEYKQFAGRAGRPGYDPEGEAILVAKKKSDLESLFDRYISASSEPLKSRLGSGGALASHVLASIASGYTATIEEIMDFLRLTFFATRGDLAGLADMVNLILGFLIKEEMIVCDGVTNPALAPGPSAGLYATPFGATISRLYLQPLSGLVLKEGIDAVDGDPTLQQLLHLVCFCPDAGILNVGSSYQDSLLREATKEGHKFLLPYPECGGNGEKYRYLQAMHTAGLLGTWMEEEPEEVLCKTFGIGPGDLRRVIESADWLLYAMEQMCPLRERKDLRPCVREIRIRTMYGIKKELCELVSLKGIGRVRARSLYRKGYKTLKDIRNAPARQLSAVPFIGPQVAENIKNQV